MRLTVANQLRLRANAFAPVTRGDVPQRAMLQDEKDMTDESFMARAVKASTDAEEASDLGEKVKSKSLEVREIDASNKNKIKIKAATIPT